MRKHAVLIAIVAASLGIVLLGSCAIGIAAIKYGPVLMRRVGVANRYTTAFDLFPPASLRVVNPRGDVTVRVEDGERVEVEAIEITYSVAEAWARRTLAQINVRDDHDEHHARVEVTLPDPLLAPDPRANLIITVPRHTSLDVSLQQGDIRIILPRDAGFVVDARTEDGGIQVGFALADQELLSTGFRNRGVRLAGRALDGDDVRIVLRTRQGNITLEPQD